MNIALKKNRNSRVGGSVGLPVVGGDVGLGVVGCEVGCGVTGPLVPTL